MEKGDDAKSTKDVKEGDGFTLSYLLGMAMLYDSNLIIDRSQ